MMIACSQALPKDKIWDIKDVYVIVLMHNGVIRSRSKDFPQIKMPDTQAKDETCIMLKNLGVEINLNVKAVFVNGRYMADDPIGRLNQSLWQSDPAQMKNDVLRAAMKKIKEPGGSEMLADYIASKYPDQVGVLTTRAYKQGQSELKKAGKQAIQLKDQGLSKDEIYQRLTSDHYSDETIYSALSMLFDE